MSLDWMMKCPFDSSLSIKDMLGLQRDLMVITFPFMKEHFVLSICALRSEVSLYLSLCLLRCWQLTRKHDDHEETSPAVIEQLGSVELELEFRDGSCPQFRDGAFPRLHACASLAAASPGQMSAARQPCWN